MPRSWPNRYTSVWRFLSASNAGSTKVSGKASVKSLKETLRFVWLAMATAMLFGAIHALMPGHGKIVLVSYHLGKPSNAIAAFTNGAILALTHVGLAVALVLAGHASSAERLRTAAELRNSRQQADRLSSSSARTYFGLL